MSKLSLPHHYSGKVRELYEVDHDRMLVVASDRVSVFDVVLPDLIPDKGRVLTALSTFWFEQTAHLARNHLVSSDPTDFPETAGPDISGRAMLVQAAQPVRLECVARGYLFGAAWSDYQETGTVRGRPLPGGLRQAERLPEPIFTPTTKAVSGHDLPLSDTDAAEVVGADLFEELRDVTLAVYRFGAAHAAERGLDPRRHQARVRAGRRATRRDRRDDDARLVALLERRRPRRRDVAAVVRQAVRARLLPVDRVEPGAAGAAHARRR